MEVDNSRINEFRSSAVDDFIIPELPEGQRLTFRIYSTWGDPRLVGLNGIEVFTQQGTSAVVENITGDFENASTTELSRDQNSIKNLIDGVYPSRNDAHSFLMQFRDGGQTSICVTLKEKSKIAMIRIWNYNKSRIHAQRGVKRLVIDLDGQIIFGGDISKAPGGCYSPCQPLGETILFTVDENILEKIAANDIHLIFDKTSAETDQKAVRNGDCKIKKRPSTGNSRQMEMVVQRGKEHLPRLSHTVSVEDSHLAFKGREFTLELRENWGMAGCIGLSGFCLLNRFGRPWALTPLMLSCNAKCDPLNRLINDRNLTVNKSSMWLSEFDGVNPVRIVIRFPDIVAVHGVRIWNYNRSLEYSYAGARLMTLYVGEGHVLTDVPLVKAPGNLHYDFSQNVLFDRPSSSTDCDLPICRLSNCAVVAFVYQLQLVSTWGDDFYIGLNGLEFYGENDRPIPLEIRNVVAHPESVNVLPDVSNDVRTSDKLIDGVNDTREMTHMWLAPILPHVIVADGVVIQSLEMEKSEQDKSACTFVPLDSC